MIRSTPTTDGAKNATVEVVVSDLPADIPWTTVVDLEKFSSPTPRRVRIDEIYYAVSDKAEVQVAWHHADGERNVLLPLAGRGRIAWPDHNGPSTPQGKGHSGSIEIRTIGLKKDQLVYLMFDLMKQ